MGLVVDDQEVYFGSSEDLGLFGLDDNSSLILTSPPYWNLKDYGHPTEIGKEDYETYLVRLLRVFEQCYDHSNDDAILAVNLSHRRFEKRYYPLMWDLYRIMVENKSRWKLIDNVIWYKPNELPQPNYYIERLLDNKFEYVLIFSKNYNYSYTFNKVRVPQKWLGTDPRSEKQNPDGRCISNIIRIPAYRPPNVKKMNYHQAAFPEELVQLFVELYTNVGDSVIDPFLGSGTTLKVCRAMKRRGIGIEINDDYQDLIKERIEEDYSLVDYKDIDLIHSATSTVDEHLKKNNKPRRKK